MSTTTTSTFADRVYETLREIAPDGYTDPETGGQVALGEFHTRIIANAIGDHEDEISSFDLNGMSNLAIGQQVCQWAGNSWHDDAKRGLGAALKVVAERLNVETSAPVTPEAIAKVAEAWFAQQRVVENGRTLWYPSDWSDRYRTEFVKALEYMVSNWTPRLDTPGEILLDWTTIPSVEARGRRFVEAWRAITTHDIRWSTEHDAERWGRHLAEVIKDCLKVETAEEFEVGDHVAVKASQYDSHGFLSFNDNYGIVTTVEECERHGWSYTVGETAGPVLVRRTVRYEDNPRGINYVHRYRPEMLVKVGSEPSSQVRASFPDESLMTAEQRSNIAAHEDFIKALQTWVADGVDDIADGVDAQMEAFATKFSEQFPGDACRSLGSTKEWVGEVMKHKRFLLNGGRLNVETPAPEAPETPETDDDRIAALERRITAVERKYQGEIREIFAALKKEANDRSWCSEYEDFLDKVDGIVSIDLDEFRRDQEWEVSWEETYTVTVRRSRTVEAGDAESAEEMALEDAGDLGIYDLYSMSADVSYEESSDVEVERA